MLRKEAMLSGQFNVINFAEQMQCSAPANFALEVIALADFKIGTCGLICESYRPDNDIGDAALPKQVFSS